jgi:hypothetical protein
MERYNEQKNTENKGRIRTDERNVGAEAVKNERYNNSYKNNDKINKNVDRKRGR